MFVGELRIEQREALPPQPRGEVYQRNLAGVGAHGEHAFAKEPAAERDAVKPARQHLAVPGLDAMGETHIMRFGVERDDVFVDPCFRPRIRTGADDAAEIFVEGDTIGLLANGAAQFCRHMQPRNRQYAAPLRVIPVDIAGMPPFRHGEDAHGIGLQQYIDG